MKLKSRFFGPQVCVIPATLVPFLPLSFAAEPPGFVWHVLRSGTNRLLPRGNFAAQFTRVTGLSGFGATSIRAQRSRPAPPRSCVQTDVF